MFEMHETANETKAAAGGSAVKTHQLDALREDGLSPEQITRLIAARDRFERGYLTETMVDLRKLRFARWLYEHGRLDG